MRHNRRLRNHNRKPMFQDVASADEFAKEHLSQLVDKAMTVGIRNGLVNMGFSEKQMSEPVLATFQVGVQRLLEDVGMAMYSQGVLVGTVAQKVME